MVQCDRCLRHRRVTSRRLVQVLCAVGFFYFLFVLVSHLKLLEEGHSRRKVGAVGILEISDDVSIQDERHSADLNAAQHKVHVQIPREKARGGVHGAETENDKGVGGRGGRGRDKDDTGGGNADGRKKDTGDGDKGGKDGANRGGDGSEGGHKREGGDRGHRDGQKGETSDGDAEDTDRGKGGGGRLPVLLWWAPISGSQNVMAECGDVRCRVTVDRRDGDFIKQPVKMYVFYGTDLRGDDLPLPRGQHELWALAHEESPKNNDFLFSHGAILELFNYTSTFRRHSSFPVPSQWLRDPAALNDTTYVVATGEKSRLRREEGLAPVVYVQSDCGAPSDRDSFVQRLMQHVQVDSYGRCLHNKDLPKRLTFEKSMSPMTSEEFYRLLARYKFAVAMENAVCEDYITEKFWRPLQLGVVPIAFGSSSLQDFLPSNKSALLVSQLGSVAAVVEAVRALDADDVLYDQYVAFKRDGVTNPRLLRHLAQRSWGQGRRHHSHFSAFECFLCRQLHADMEHWSRGQRISQSVATKEHFGCPMPLRFDTEGRYADKADYWMDGWRWSLGLAKAIRHFYDQGETPSEKQLESLAHKIEKNITQEDLSRAGTLAT